MPLLKNQSTIFYPICAPSVTFSVCYTLSRSRDLPSSVTVLWAVGLRRVHSSVLSVIMIIPFTHLSPNSIPPFMFPIFVLFHVSVLIRKCPFRSIFDPRARTPNLTYARFSLPCNVPFGTYTLRPSCMFLSLKSTLIVPRTHHPNLRTLVCLSPEIRGQ